MIPGSSLDMVPIMPSRLEGDDMLKLCGFHISNYLCKVRIAMLEKGVPFELDPTCKPSQKDDFLARTPMGKVPFVELDGGAQLAESQVICEYLEDAYPQKPLYPRDALERARVRELITFMELHVELVARRLYGQVFFGRPVSDDLKQAAEKDLVKGIRAFRARAKFDPYVCGAQLTLADCAAFVHLPLVSLATKHAFGKDMLESMPQIKPYLKMLGEAAELESGEISGVVPLAVPLLAGPGAISTTIIAAQAGGIVHVLALLACIGVVCAVLWWMLRIAHAVGERMGTTGLNIATR